MGGQRVPSGLFSAGILVLIFGLRGSRLGVFEGPRIIELAAWERAIVVLGGLAGLEWWVQQTPRRLIRR